MIRTHEALVRRLNELCAEQPFETGWFFKDLRSGEAADRRGEVIVPSASTRKVSILMTALRAVHRGALSLDQPVTMDAKYQRNDSGVFQHLRPGFTITFQDALTMMIIVSDNTCTGTVADLLGLDDINEFCRSAGMAGTTHRMGLPPMLDPLGQRYQSGPTDGGGMNATTPRDVALLLELILQGAAGAPAAARLGSTPELCRLAIDILSRQVHNSRLPALLPTGTKVAHKTGTGPSVVNDVGIIFEQDRPLFILTVYTGGVPSAMPNGAPGRTAASHHIARMSRACWDELRAGGAPRYTGS
ncbi:MAG: serine hydrolase [bacterium]